MQHGRRPLPRLGAAALASICLSWGLACGVDERRFDGPVGSDAGSTGGRSGQLGNGAGGSSGVPGSSGGSSLPSGIDTDGDLSADAGCPGCPSGDCEPGLSLCSSERARVECTTERVWSAPAACDFVCAGGGCGGECVPDSTECLSTTTHRVCLAEGAWSEARPCENACVGGACGGECRPGAQRCLSGTEVQSCTDEGAWGPTRICENACSGDACTGECAPQTTRCSSATQVQSCNDQGQWLTPAACDLACVGDACGGECAPGDRRCSDAGLPQVCAGGSWQDDAACPFVCVGRGTCGGECRPQERRCNPVSGVPQLCSDTGQWQNQAACQFVCSAGFCGGECSPGSVRCDTATGVPQRCGATGQWQNQAACGAGASCAAGSCLCNQGLATCGNACTDLTQDSQNCGSCGHSCQGGLCTDGRCEPVTLATGQASPGNVLSTSTHVYWVDAGSADSLAVVRRVPKGGGAVEDVVSGLGRMDGFAIGGSQLYVGIDDRRTANARRRVVRANLDGTGLSDFSPDDTDGVSGVFVDGSFVFYRSIIGVNVSSEVYRAPLLSQGQAGAGAPVLFATVDGSITMTVAGGCLYYVSSRSSAELMRVCSPGATPVRHYLGQGNVGMRAAGSADATHLYFKDVVRGMLRIPLAANGNFEVLVAGAVPEAGSPTVDTDALYYFAQTGSLGAPACTDAHTLFRASKTVGAGAPEEILPPPRSCPTQVAVDASALYWSESEGGTVAKLAK